MCTSLCATVARDRLPDKRLAVRPPPWAVQPPIGAVLWRGRARCLLLWTAVVDAIIVVPSLTRGNLYVLLQYGEDSEYERKAYSGYIEVFWVLLVKDGESSPPASRNFQSGNA
jgi:hypothetical protein